MRKIRKYNAEKYKNEDYTEVEKNIYQKSGESFYRTSFHLSRTIEWRGEISQTYFTVSSGRSLRSFLLFYL